MFLRIDRNSVINVVILGEMSGIVCEGRSSIRNSN